MTYTTSQKIAIINDIDLESRELWLMLNDNHNYYSKDSIKKLFVDMLNKDASGCTRFDLKTCESYINKVATDTVLKERSRTSFDTLNLCHTATRKSHMHSFLFDTASK